jgi:hypothetical protein
LKVIAIHEIADVVSNKDSKGNPLPQPEIGADFPIQQKLDGLLQFYVTTWRPVATGLGCTPVDTIKTWVEKMQGATVHVVIGHQKDKDGKLDSKNEPVYYTRVNSARLA